MKLIKNGTIINEGRSFLGHLLLDGKFIKEKNYECNTNEY